VAKTPNIIIKKKEPWKLQTSSPEATPQCKKPQDSLVFPNQLFMWLQQNRCVNLGNKITQKQREHWGSDQHSRCFCAVSYDRI